MAKAGGFAVSPVRKVCKTHDWRGTVARRRVLRRRACERLRRENPAIAGLHSALRTRAVVQSIAGKAQIQAFDRQPHRQCDA